MPHTEPIKRRSISRDAIAGEDLRGQIASLAQQIEATTTASTTTAGNSNLWKKSIVYATRLLRNLKLWIMDEQLTAVAGRSNIFNVSGLAYNTDTWVSLQAFHNLVSFTLYAIKDNHYYFNLDGGGFDVFIAPDAGDYTFNLYSEFVLTGVTQNDYYVYLLLSTKQNNAASWSSTPLVVGGGTNINLDPSPNTIIQATGTYTIRLGRGDKIRFGIKNVGRAAAAINSGDVSSSQYRVTVTKNKFYPTLE